MAQSEIHHSGRDARGISMVQFRRLLLQGTRGEQPSVESRDNETPDEQKARVFAQSISAQVFANMVSRRERIFGSQE